VRLDRQTSETQIAGAGSALAMKFRNGGMEAQDMEILRFL